MEGFKAGVVNQNECQIVRESEEQKAEARSAPWTVASLLSLPCARVAAFFFRFRHLCPILTLPGHKLQGGGAGCQRRSPLHNERGCVSVCVPLAERPSQTALV